MTFLHFFGKIVGRFIFFYHLCTRNQGEPVSPEGRNSSAVEHFTRNEGVPSSNLGFGSEQKRKRTKDTFVLFLFCSSHIDIPPKLGSPQKSGGEGKKVSTISGFARYCRNTLRHCELLHFRGYRKAQRNHAKVWQSTAYQKPRIAPNRLIGRAVERICISLIIGRSPRIFMQGHQILQSRIMKILGMTRCVFPTKFFLPPRNRFARSIFPLAHRHASKYSENLGQNPIIFTTFVW